MTPRLKVLLLRWLLPTTTAALYALALPPFHLDQFGWIALIPLLFALHECSAGEAFRRGYIAGLVFFGATVWWTAHVSLLGMVALVAFLALYFGLAAVWFAKLFAVMLDGKEEAAGRNLIVAALATTGWVAIEWVRGWFLFGGFGWNFLGVTQHRAIPLIQIASLAGAYGVSALLCFVNIAFYVTIRRFVRQTSSRERPRWRLSWEFYLAMLLVSATFLYGVRVQLDRHVSNRKLRLAFVQGNIPQTLKFDPAEKPMILERYDSRTRAALTNDVDMILWPETATPEPMRYDIDSFALVTNLAQRANAYLLTGTIDLTPSSKPPEAFNAAVLVRPDGTLDDIYRKIHLVVFGEYVPLRKIFPFMKWLTPIQDSFERGTKQTIFVIEPPSLAGSAEPEARFGVVICFEDTVPALYRGFVRRGVDFMVNLTNDAWFKTSPAAAMHLANAVFRCAETRRPLVRATNSGVTCVVDEFGYVQTSLAPFTEATLICELSLPAERTQTFYSKRGDVFVCICATLTGAAIVWMATRKPLHQKV